MKIAQPRLSIVVPLFNEENVFPELVKRLEKLKTEFTFSLEFVLVDDGSSDRTPILMKEISEKYKEYHSIFLSRNFGHQTAISAGLQFALGTKAIMIMDGDLQDPPEMITRFYEKISEGYDVVYAIRRKRKEGVFKKVSYWTYYRILKSLAKIDIPVDSGDFSMLSRRVVDVIKSMPERERFLRGMRSWVGFKQTGIEYERSGRFAGEPKYSFVKLIKLALNGIFNFSDRPLKLITATGLLTIGVSLIYILYILAEKIFYNNVPQGFTATIVVVTLFSGVQLISLGIIGEYLARIYNQVKERPLFVVKSRIINKEELGGEKLL